MGGPEYLARVLFLPRSGLLLSRCGPWLPRWPSLVPKLPSLVPTIGPWGDLCSVDPLVPRFCLWLPRFVPGYLNMVPGHQSFALVS